MELSSLDFRLAKTYMPSISDSDYHKDRNICDLVLIETMRENQMQKVMYADEHDYPENVDGFKAILKKELTEEGQEEMQYAESVEEVKQVAVEDHRRRRGWKAYLRRLRTPKTLRDYLDEVHVDEMEKEEVVTAEIYSKRYPQKREELLNLTLQRLTDKQLIHYCYMELGKQRLNKGKQEEAMQDFQSAREYDDARIGPYIAIAHIHEKNRDWSLAAEVLEQGHRHFKDNTRYLRYGIRIYKECGYDTLICRNYDMILEKEPTRNNYREYLQYLERTKSDRIIECLTSMRKRGYRI